MAENPLEPQEPARNRQTACRGERAAAAGIHRCGQEGRREQAVVEDIIRRMSKGASSRRPHLISTLWMPWLVGTLARFAGQALPILRKRSQRKLALIFSRAAEPGHSSFSVSVLSGAST